MDRCSISNNADVVWECCGEEELSQKAKISILQSSTYNRTQNETASAGRLKCVFFAARLAGLSL